MKAPRSRGYPASEVLLELVASGLVTVLAVGTETVPRRIVVLPPQVEGQAAGLDQTVAASLDEAVSNAGAEPIRAPEGCADAACGGEEAGADGYVLVTTVAVTGSDYVLGAKLVDGQGEVVEESEGTCDICTPPEAAAKSSEMAQRLVEPVATLEVEPEPVPAEEPPPPKKDNSKLLQGLGFAAVGVGAASLIAGIALLVLNDRSVQGSCEGDGVDADGNCEFLWNTLGGGIGLTIGGALVAGGGVGLLIYNKKRNGRTKAEVAIGAGSLEVRF